MATQDGIAYYWAKALFAAAKKHNEIDNVDLDLDLVRDVVKFDRSAGVFFNHPLISVSEKTKVVEEALKSRSARGLLGIMFKLHDFSLLSAVAHRYKMMVKEARREKDVEVRVPAAIAEESLKGIKETIRAMAGGNVNLIVEQDPSLIGGVWMKVGSTVYDGTFRKDLNLLKERLLA
jgi:F-type H+-transporting ATPase subunit delta